MKAQTIQDFQKMIKPMPVIDLNQIITVCELDIKDLAQVLFPDNLHPVPALQRVLAGTTLLNSRQITLLSLHTDLTIEQIFGEKWVAKSKENLHTFTRGDFKVELDTNTWITKIYEKGNLLFDKIISSGTVSLNEYFTELDNIIFKFKN